MKALKRLKGMLLAVCLFVCGLSVFFAVRSLAEVAEVTEASADTAGRRKKFCISPFQGAGI